MANALTTITLFCNLLLLSCVVGYEVWRRRKPRRLTFRFVGAYTPTRTPPGTKVWTIDWKRGMCIPVPENYVPTDCVVAITARQHAALRAIVREIREVEERCGFDTLFVHTLAELDQADLEALK